MRILAITRGVPGCGKSTWIKDNGLDKYCLSPDDLRMEYAGLERNVDGTLKISQSKDSIVWSNVYEMLDGRMLLGKFTVIDATHTKQADIEKYEKMCKKHNYELVVVDFSDVPVEVCKERNAKRTPDWKIVPEEVIDRMYERLQYPLGKKYQDLLCSPDDFMAKYYKAPYINLDKYNKVIVFGDIHGCFSPLQNYFWGDEYSRADLSRIKLRDDYFYIFLGDYIDRGIQNAEVIDFLHDIRNKENVVLLLGNHERHIERMASGDSIQYVKETMRTLSLLDKESVKKLKDIVASCKLYYSFEFAGDRYLATHGGIPTDINNFEYYAKEVISGVGDYSASLLCDEYFEKRALEQEKKDGFRYFSIHGHRNIGAAIPVKSTSRTFNLCDEIEYGKYLRIIEIDKEKEND